MKKGMNIPDLLDHRSAVFNTEIFNDRAAEEVAAEEIEHAVLA
jgi:hypothetical protein